MHYDYPHAEHQQQPALSQRVQTMQASLIRDVAETGMKMDGVIPLWFGESAWSTPAHIVDAAIESLRHQPLVYQPNNGLPELRNALKNYCADQFGAQCTTEQITVTPSGMQGLMLCAQLLVTPGDLVVAIEPSWPNIPGCFEAMGARVRYVPLHTEIGRWQLDMNRLIDALDESVRIVLINSPNNPTGWSMSATDQQHLLEHCRQQGIWIVADDVYARLYRHASSAPSFLSIAQPDDRVISVNSFSKAWSMTGWRLGWLVTPPHCETPLGHLTEFNTSCTAGFVQQAGVRALLDGEPDIAQLSQRLKLGYAATANALEDLPRVEFIEPDGAFYAFFRVDGLDNSYTAALNILQETGVGLAPGSAFGTTGEGYLRLCYAQPEAVLEEAFNRLMPLLRAT